MIIFDHGMPKNGLFFDRRYMMPTMLRFHEAGERRRRGRGAVKAKQGTGDGRQGQSAMWQAPGYSRLMGKEIERKFLVRGDYSKEVFESHHIVQGYLCHVTGKTVRVRILDGKAILTIKGPSDSSGIGRFEWEKEITLQDAEDLLTIAEPGLVDKTRHLVRNLDGVHVWEIDEFHGDNEGLVVAEIELGSADEDFIRPEWLGEEVSMDRRYFNSSLIRHPFKDWK